LEFVGEQSIKKEGELQPMHDLPSALEQRDAIIQRLKTKRVAVFLDYDGTLTPIVARPELALLSEDMRQTVKDLASRCPVAIVSGRDRADVQQLVQIDTVIYAGSHGFDIAGLQGMHIQHEQGANFLAELDHATEELSQKLTPVEGAQIERKKFSIAVHFRGVAQERESVVESIVDSVLTHHPELRKGWGKKVFELQPRVDWHKGKAVLWLLEALALNGPDALPLYIGDDVTDEDAFTALADRGIGILVAETPRPTAASYLLKNPDEVKTFLHYLTTALET
jgi:alpha,alpha-trehalase